MINFVDKRDFVPILVFLLSLLSHLHGLLVGEHEGPFLNDISELIKSAARFDLGAQSGQAWQVGTIGY